MYTDNMEVTHDQQRELLAMREFYGFQDKPCTRVHIKEFDEVELPLEKSRILGPFGLDVLAWVRKNPFVTMGWDADGREYIEY